MVKKETELEADFKQLHGLGGMIHSTLGSVELSIKYGEEVLNHRVLVVGDDFPIEADAIVGLDFLNAVEAKLDFQQGTLELGGMLINLGLWDVSMAGMDDEEDGLEREIVLNKDTILSREESLVKKGPVFIGQESI
jgi:hypothetical protein